MKKVGAGVYSGESGRGEGSVVGDLAVRSVSDQFCWCHQEKLQSRHKGFDVIKLSRHVSSSPLTLLATLVALLLG